MLTYTLDISNGLGSFPKVQGVASEVAALIGHHFASYDGEEQTFGDWFVFRTN